MIALLRILYAEALATLVAAILVTPLAMFQALSHRWAGLHAYVRCTCWGGAGITAVAFVSVWLGG